MFSPVSQQALPRDLDLADRLEEGPVGDGPDWLREVVEPVTMAEEEYDEDLSDFDEDDFDDDFDDDFEEEEDFEDDLPDDEIDEDADEELDEEDLD